MRNYLKKIYLTLLESKAKQVLNSDSKLIFIIGDVSRSLYSQQFLEFLTNLSYHIERTPLGYNHRLGVALTLLGIKAGKSSIKYWISVLFRPVRKLLVKTLFIIEIAFTNDADVSHFVQLYKPDFLVTTNDITLNIDNLPCYSSKDGIIYFQGQEIAKILTSNQNHEHVCTYQKGGSAETLKLNNFGVQYEVPSIIAIDIRNKLS